MAKVEIWTTLKVLNWTKEFLASKGVLNARLESEWLLCAATGLDRVGLYLNFEKPLIDSELSVFRAMVARRAMREPLQHILGTQEFCGLEFEVTPDVLIPRHDTETLVNESIMRMPGARSILDVGTGSGCIAVTLARQLPAAAVTATDISESALAVARRNAERHSVDIDFLAGSLFAPLVGRRFDLVVSNPPYIPENDIAALEPEVRDFDPHGALNGGSDGLNFYRALIPEAIDYLNPGGFLLLEIGIGQADDVAQLFLAAGGYGQPFTTLDPGGIQRVVGALRKENA
ncbi:MAG: peptide chain release factor N(5)-glutamine methyltransferase [Deltaproteobacteria bacterium]|nr:peptide chain release factor N(5)-glutamine methyltransferase [Deltaproteobacteria bacterium]